MKKLALSILLVFILSFNGYAEDEDGGLPGYFMNLGVSPRALSMGRAYTASANDFGALYWNPAALSELKTSELSAMYIQLFEDTHYGVLGYARRNFGIGIIRLGTGDFEGRDELNYPTGEEYDQKDIAVMLSLGARLREWLSLGMSCKFVDKDMEDVDAENGIMYDIGLLYKSLSIPLKVGLKFENVFTIQDMEINNTRYKFPQAVKLGIAYSLLSEKLTLAMDLNNTTGRNLKLHTGLEYWIVKDQLAIRAGYDAGNLVFGSGVKVGSIRLDYALLPFHKLGTSHRVSITWCGKKRK
jgi:hypothetical protein